MFQLRDKLLDMDLKKLHCFEQTAPKSHTPTKGEPAASTRRIGIMCNQNRATVVCMDCDGIVVRNFSAES